MNESEDVPVEDIEGDAARTSAMLRELHEATRDLMNAQTPSDIATVASHTGRDVLGLEVNAVFFPRGDRLVAVEATDAAHDLFDEMPAMHAGKSMAWRVFQDGEPAVFDDVREADLMQNPETKMRSELLLPLGEHGLFVAGSTTPAEFTDEHVSIGKVFAANVETALDRAEREQHLTRQNERLEQFASVVSHDLRNPLNVAQGRLELAMDECDSDHLEDVARAHDRIADLIDDLLTLAREGRMVGETEPVDFAAVVRDAERDVQADIEVVVDPVGHLEADRGRLRELLSNLLSNVADHGGETVWLGPLADGKGFYVADDGPGIDDDRAAKVFDHGYTTSETGTGFGLAIVEEIATAHGWSVSLTESASGGARFEIRVTPSRE